MFRYRNSNPNQHEEACYGKLAIRRRGLAQNNAPENLSFCKFLAGLLQAYLEGGNLGLRVVVGKAFFI